ncbi:MAG: O-antigen ligase family protein [Microthrixaceae bacterium]
MSGPLSIAPIRNFRFGYPIDRPMREGWPIMACTAAMPLMFIGGLQGIVWVVPGVVLSVRLLRRPTTRIPRSALLLGMALVWMLFSIVQVKLGGLPLFAYRWTLFLGAFASEVYLVNVSGEKLPTQRIVRWMASLWIANIAFGWMAILFAWDLPSPFLIALGPAGNIEFIEFISAWRLAEVQGFLGFPLPRPSAPWPAANGWGSATGLLFPFFVSAWLVDARGRRRVVGVLVLAAAIYPIVMSFNRGLWASLAIVMAYLALRRTLAGRPGAVALVVVAGFAVALIYLLTPIGDLADTKVDTADDSNDARGLLYQKAVEGAQESPLVGNGAPRRFSPDHPPAGTHGMLWYLLFVHGFVVAGLYVGWLAIELIRSAPSRSPGSLWFHTAILVAAFQTMIYGMLPQVVLVGITVGLARRAARDWRRDRDRDRVERALSQRGRAEAYLARGDAQADSAPATRSAPRDGVQP